MSESDRRGGERHLACYPAGVQQGGREPGLALIRDLSVSGALLFVERPLTEGETVAVQLHIAADPDVARDASAKVVRVTRRSPEQGAIWKYSVAVHFEPPLEAFRREIDALKEKLPPTPVGDP